MDFGWDDTALAALEGGQPRLAIFLRIATSPNLIRVWGGIGDFAIDADDTVEDEDGAVYSGMGELSGLPILQQLINGEADRVDFTVAGTILTPHMQQMATSEAGLLRGAQANVGIMLLGRSLQPISSVAWLQEVECDIIGIAREQGDTGAVRSITISAATVMSGRRRARSLQWTDPDQNRESAGDRLCEMVAAYNAGTTRSWPI